MYKLFILLLASNFLFSQNEKEKTNDTIIFWNESQKLQWLDYKGALNPNLLGNAYTVYKIEVVPEEVLVDANDRIQNIEQLNIVTYFLKNKSWTTSNSIPLLNHEQLHFDIAELFARRIRKRFLELKNNKENRFSIYQGEYARMLKECREFQKEYDEVTNHGIEIEKNKEWIDRVTRSIEALNFYAY